MKFGELPDPVLYALVLQAANFDMDTTEKMTAGQALRRQEIGGTPGDVIRTVEQACEDVRRNRRDI